jgi:hypothetical protein
MNLSEIADVICTQVRLTDETAVAACKKFLRRRHQYIWNEALWRDSLAQINITYAPDDNDLHALGIYLLPSSVDRVLACRTADKQLTAANEEEFYQTNLDAYDQTGDEVGYYLMSKVVWQFATAPAAVTFWWVGTDQATGQENTGNMQIKYLDSANVRQNISGDYGDAETVMTNPLVVESISCPANLAYDYNYSADDAASYFATIPAGETMAARRWRLRLLNIPVENKTVKVLVKKTAPDFTNDYDEPFISNAENCLIALAAGDMMKFLRSHASANEYYAEGRAMLDQLKKIEVAQQAFRAKIIPNEVWDSWDTGFDYPNTISVAASTGGGGGSSSSGIPANSTVKIENGKFYMWDVGTSAWREVALVNGQFGTV